MRKRILFCAAVVAAGLIVIKPWAKAKIDHTQADPIQASWVTSGQDKMLTLHNAVGEPATEESEPIEVIDLSQLPNQPPEPVYLPEISPELLAALVVTPHAEEEPAGPTPMVPAFEPYAAVPEKEARTSFSWAKFAQIVADSWKSDAPGAGPSYAPVMVVPSSYHRDHPECPYLGGAKGEDAEAQDAPVKKNPTKRK
jgi:hypothetical protein